VSLSSDDSQKFGDVFTLVTSVGNTTRVICACSNKGINMEQGSLAFTAVYLKAKHGYIGFIEELPGVNSHGSTIEEARETLRGLAALIFDEQGRGEQMVAGENVMREPLLVPVPLQP